MAEENQTLHFLKLITRELETSFKKDDLLMSDLSVYYVDLLPLRTRLSSEAPCIQVTHANRKRHGRQELLQLIGQELFLRQDLPGSALVLVEDDDAHLYDLRKDPYWALVFERADMAAVVNSPNPKRALLAAVRAQLPLRFLSPYDAEQPAVGSQFHGRNTELNLALSYPERSYTVEGGRRIGKTSLLKEIRRRLRQTLPVEQHRRVVWYDFWGYKGLDAFLSDTMRHFSMSPRPARGTMIDYFPEFIRIMRRRHGGRIIFLLDEIDDLIDYEHKHGSGLLDFLKRIEAAEDCRCFIAGFRLLTEERNRYGTPLSFCRRLPLGNLKREQARAMIMEPMQNMGIDISMGIFQQIYTDTGGHPQLLQIYGQGLIEILDEAGERRVTRRHLQEAKTASALYERLVGTLIDNTSDLEFALACSLADYDQFGLAEVDEILQANGIHKNIKEIRAICQSLKGIGIIESSAGASDLFFFAIPLQPSLAAKSQGVVELAWRKATRDI